MAASMTMKMNFVLNLLIFCFFSTLSCENSYLYTFQPSDILREVQNSCFVGVTTSKDVDLMGRLAKLAEIFADEEHVTVGIIGTGYTSFPADETQVEIDGLNCEKLSECESVLPDLLFFPRIEVDRTCLLTSHKKPKLDGEVFYGPSTLDVLIAFVNAKCGTFRTANGGLSSSGIHRKQILENLFGVTEISDLTIRKLYSSKNNPLHNVSYTSSKRTSNAQTSIESCSADPGNDCNSDTDDNIHTYKKYHQQELPKCSVISLPLSEEDFFVDYLQMSKPFIIKGGVKKWPAMTKWTQDFLREKYGEKKVHVKLTPGGDFEGVEKAERWEDFGNFKIPDEVKQKLPYPDLVVVRPAGVNMKFREFLDLITWAAQQPERNVSAYLEYSSIPEYMSELEQDLEEFDFAQSLLKRRHLNIWLSDGNTLGRLHFDPYDNFLCQFRGRKQVILFEPHQNDNLYESHIPQATLGYSRENHRFRRKTLEDSTSMVMSPVDLLNPDLERFPNFGDARPLNCTIDEGDALFMPAFWWHEVYSWPNTAEKRNLAVNFWYEPFLTKEFPCQECKLDVNSFYHHLL